MPGAIHFARSSGSASRANAAQCEQESEKNSVAVNRACKVLEDRGLAVRRPNAQDGRSHLLGLTAAGQAMHGEIMPLALEMERRLFATFTDQEVETFRSLLGRVRDEVDDLDADDLDRENFGVA